MCVYHCKRITCDASICIMDTINAFVARLLYIVYTFLRSGKKLSYKPRQPISSSKHPQNLSPKLLAASAMSGRYRSPTPTRHRGRKTDRPVRSRSRNNTSDRSINYNSQHSKHDRSTKTTDYISPRQLQRHYEETIDRSTASSSNKDKTILPLHRHRSSRDNKERSRSLRRPTTTLSLSPTPNRNSREVIRDNEPRRKHRSPKPEPDRTRSYSRHQLPKEQKKDFNKNEHKDNHNDQYKSDRRRHSPHRTPSLESNKAHAPAPPTITTFRPDRNHYDINEVAHLNFPKKIKTTDHSITNGTAKRDPYDIYLWEMLYNKSENWGLRYLAHGRYTSIEITKSFKESVFIQELLRNIRGYKLQGGQDGPPPIDLDTIATDYARNNDLPFKTGTDKKHIYTIIAKQTYDFLNSKTPSAVTNDMQKRLKELEQENATLKASQKPIFQALGAKAINNHTAAPEPIDINRGDKDKILSTCAPNSTKPADVDAWIKQLKLSPQQQKTLSKLTTDIQAHIGTMDDPVAMEHLRTVLCEWGLSISLAAKFKTSPLLVKILAHILAKTQ